VPPELREAVADFGRELGDVRLRLGRLSARSGERT